MPELSTPTLSAPREADRKEAASQALATVDERQVVQSPGPAPSATAVTARVQKLPFVPLLRVLELPEWGRRRGLAAARISRKSPILASFFAAVILPTLAAGLYYGFIASYQYVSEFRATVRSLEPIKATGVTALLGLAGASQSASDANAVVQYLQSRDALEELDQKVGLRTQYSSNSIDWLSRLKDSGSIEGFLRYWHHRLEAYYETSTGTIVVRVSAFTPAMALAAAAEALSLSEALINRLSMRALNDSVRFAESKVSEAEQRLTAANQRLRLVQDQEKILDPQSAAASMLTLAAKLREQLASLNADLAVQSAYMSKDAPTVKIAQAQIDSLQHELEKINANVTTTPGATDKPLSGVLGTFDQVESDRGFAEKNYQSALASLEAARIEAGRQQVYLATIVRPELPQEESFPKPLINTATVFAIAMIAWAVGLLSVFAVKEHI